MSVSLQLPRRIAFDLTGPPPVRLRRHVAIGLRLIGQLGLLWAVLAAGGVLSGALRLPLPGNLTGMLLLLALLWTRVIPLAWVQDLAAILVRHLMLFFIPLGVGLMVWQNLFAESGLAIGVSLAGSAVIGILVAGLSAQAIASVHRRGASNVS